MAYQAAYLNARIADDADARPSHPIQNYGIVLAGKTGSGKSATGNTILGRTAFDATPSGKSVTNVSSYGKSVYRDRTITVVDTPGIHGNVKSASNIKEEIARMAFLLREGVHCFVICMNASEVRVTKETKIFLDQVKVSGHTNFYDHCMLVYTKPEAELRNISLEEFVERQKDDECMKRFLEKLGDMVMVVSNNTVDPGEDTRNQDAIIAMVDKVIENNIIKQKPIVFTNNTFEKAKELRKQVVTLVERENCHPSLVNAVIEAIILFSKWGTISKEKFVDKVLEILCKNQQYEMDGTNVVFRNDNLVTTTPVVDCKRHIEIIYEAVRSNISVFYQMLATIHTHTIKYTMCAGAAVVGAGLAVGTGGGAVAAAILGLPPIIAYSIGNKMS